MSARSSDRLRIFAFAGFVALDLAILATPLGAWLAHAWGPRLLGLPAFFGLHVLFIGLSLGALVLFDSTREREPPGSEAP